ncbi:MAG: hypothetical protein JST58_17645 [Bacteroidetes bacterium]|nr:hypothetical protein [Bacteroidota bacterium]
MQDFSKPFEIEFLNRVNHKRIAELILEMQDVAPFEDMQRDLQEMLCGYLGSKPESIEAVKKAETVFILSNFFREIKKCVDECRSTLPSIKYSEHSLI